MPPLRLLAAGREADVYALDDTRVLRRFRRPEGRDTTREAAVMRWVADHGYPVPHVHDAEGPDIVLERLHGPTVMQAWERTPWRIAHYARQLADLHDRLAAVPAPPWLETPAALGALGAPDPADPAGGDPDAANPSVLHLDLHPLNVILTPDRGPVVIDWPSAAAGQPALELARTLVTIATADLPRARIRLVRRPFLTALRRHAAADPGPRMADAARTRLTGGNTTPAEIARLQAVIDRAAGDRADTAD